MGLRQREWAKKQRLLLRRKLGMRCHQCGSRFYLKLEFDCIRPCGDQHHKMEWSWRMSFYRQQYAAGNLQLLCDRCHQLKSSKEQPT